MRNFVGMRKFLTAAVTFMVTAQALSAQEFGPSQQAQAYTDAKNVSVDYATGLFHYSVPIYTLKSGGFELPVSLD